MAEKKRGRAATLLLAQFDLDACAATSCVLEAIRESDGALVAVAKRLGIGERTLDRVLADHPELATAAQAARDAGKRRRDAMRSAKGAA
jgi:hypothetical protein